MRIDIKTLAFIISFATLLVGAAMAYGSLTTRVNTLEHSFQMRSGADAVMARDITEMKTNIATLIERTKP